MHIFQKYYSHFSVFKKQKIGINLVLKLTGVCVCMGRGCGDGGNKQVGLDDQKGQGQDSTGKSKC